MENITEEIVEEYEIEEVEEKKTLKEKIKENWKSILKVTGIVGGVSALAGFVYKLTHSDDDYYVIDDVPFEEIDSDTDEVEDDKASKKE